MTTPQRRLLEPNEVLGGTYEVRALLGEGGMGQVYEAHDLALNRRVAIKVPWPHVAESVRNEAHALAALHHPGVATVYGLGVHDGVDYMVMERIYGVSLEAHIDARRAAKPRFEIAEAAEILARIADALAAVHAAGIAHRDVKPPNIMLAPHDRIVLMDFGIFLPEIEVGDDHQVRGSPWYMAPEAVANSVHPGDAFLVDVYSFGIVAYEMLAGHVPFEGPAVRVLCDQLATPPPDLAQLRAMPPRLAALVHELLAKNPNDRPQSMDAVAWRLRGVLQGDEPVRPLTVVVAEDNAATATILRELILNVRPDAEVLVAHDGRRALELMRKHKPHLMLLDLNLPRMNGVEICMYLRGAPGADTDCTIVSVSAAARPDDLELLRKLGFGAFIPKGEALASRLPTIVEGLARKIATRPSMRPPPLEHGNER